MGGVEQSGVMEGEKAERVRSGAAGTKAGADGREGMSIMKQQ